MTPQADDGCTIVDMHVFADEAIGRSRKYCNRECRSKAVNTSVSWDKTTMFFQHTAATVMYNHRISQAGRNPWGSLSPTPWNTCSLCLVAEIERSYSSRGCFQLGQMQVEDNIRLIQQKTNVVRRCDVVLSTCMVSKTDRACLSVGVTSCQPDWLPGEDVPVG